MTVIRRSIKWVMLVAGLLTCTMFQAVFDPQASLISNFGQGLDGPVAEIVVRNWGALIGLMGLLLIYGAWHEPVRAMVVLVVGASKLVFITLVLWLGQPFLQFQVGVAIAVDAVLLLLFAAWLVAERAARRTDGEAGVAAAR